MNEPTKPKPVHPWFKAWQDKEKLKAARKTYRKRYENGQTKYGDKHKEINRINQRTKYRLEHGLDLEAPARTYKHHD